MGTVREWDVEMEWRCGACGKFCPGLTGTEKESLRCIHCGYEKTAADEWIMPEDVSPERAVTGIAAERARQAPNQSCPYCRAESRATATECEDCGASFAAPVTAESSAVPAPSSFSKPTVPAPSSSRKPKAPSSAPYRAASPRESYPSAPPRLPPRSTRWVGWVVAAFSLLALAMWAMCTEETIQVQVTGLEWEHRVDWRLRREYEDTGWIDTARSARHVIATHSCQSLQRGTTDCEPHPCRCRPDISCNCTGGDTYDCPPCSGGGTESCNCRDVDPYDCRCTRSVRSRSNGAARVREECDTCYRRRVCDQCPVPRRCATCRTPRVCQRCPRDRCDTCWNQCPVYAQWCSYRYDQWESQPPQLTRGQGHAYTWPEVPATPNVDLRTSRTATYWITYRRVGGTPAVWRERVESSQYGHAEMGQRYEAGLNRLGSLSLRHRLP